MWWYMLYILYIQVTPVNREIFNKWKQFDDNVHCDSVVAYLEDENCGYLVKEHLENGKLFHLYC